jgi:hypothetical protein
VALDIPREPVDVDFHRHQEIVAQDFARVSERKPLARGHISKVDPAPHPNLRV